MTTQTELEAAMTGAGTGLGQHIKAYIESFVSSSQGLQDIDITKLNSVANAIMTAMDDDDDETNGLALFTQLKADVQALAASQATNSQRVTAVEQVLATIQTALTNNEGRIGILETFKETVNASLATITGSIATLTAAVTALENAEHYSRAEAVLANSAFTNAVKAELPIPLN